MSESYDGDIVRFTADDIRRFSAASRDTNPLHLSALYARKTVFGEPVVFGVLGGLACLARLNDRAGFALSKIQFEFTAPMFVGVDYRIETTDLAPERATVKLRDGRRTVLKGTVEFCEGEIGAAPDAAADSLFKSEPRDFSHDDLTAGVKVEGAYAPDWLLMRDAIELRRLEQKGIGPIEVASLMWCSYAVGMGIPGRRALFSRLSLKMERPRGGSQARMNYEAKSVSFDKRFDLLKIEASLYDGKGPIAAASLQSFVRQDEQANYLDDAETLPRSNRLKGKVALVIGGSRGLGARIAQSLALEGCTVLVNYLHSETEAYSLKQSLPEIRLLQGDAGDLSWCTDANRIIATDYGRLDLLVCNACPPLLPLWIETGATERINEYVGKSLALVTAPMSAFLPALSESAGWNVVISSIAVMAPPAEWPHYVSAKFAIEGFVKVAAAEYTAVSFLLVRPPRLLTDLTNTPLGRQSAMPPVRVARKIAERITGAACAGQMEILQDFSSSDSDSIAIGY